MLSSNFPYLIDLCTGIAAVLLLIQREGGANPAFDQSSNERFEEALPKVTTRSPQIAALPARNYPIVSPTKQSSWRRRSRVLPRTRNVIYERPTPEERALRREVCVGGAPRVSYQVALRLLRRGIPLADVARRVSIPIGEVEHIQSILWEYEVAVRDEAMLSSQVHTLVEDIQVLREPSTEPTPREPLIISQLSDVISREKVVL